MKLLVFNDGSTDETFEKIQGFLKEKAELGERVSLQGTLHNNGVAQARTTLLDWSATLNPNAYIFWLDAGDQYTDKSFVRNAVQQMKKTKADICLFNFSITYEDENQKMNALGLNQDRENSIKILDTISIVHDTF